MTVAQGDATLWAHPHSFEEVCPRSHGSRPSIVSLVGKRKKRSMLGYMLGKSENSAISRAHGQIRLMRDARTTSQDAPLVYADCELSLQSSPSFDTQNTLGTPRSVSWLHNNDADSRCFASDFYASVLNPLSNVVCYFASDLNGVFGVAELLARQVTGPRTHTLPASSLPHVLVVIESTSKVFDSSISQRKLLLAIKEAAGKWKKYDSIAQLEEDLSRIFRAIEVIGLQVVWDEHVRSLVLRRRLVSLSKEVQWGRRTSRHLFTVEHVDALAERILTAFCLDRSCFNFMEASRPENFDHCDLDSHLHELMEMTPNLSWFSHFSGPLIASALFLASYPPGAHAIAKLTSDQQTQRNFIKCIKDNMEQSFARFEFDTEGCSALDQHTERLKSLWPNFARFKSFKSCFSCLMLMPEKVFDCGHAICNVCIRRFGERPRSEKHEYTLIACILCGQSQSKRSFRLKPPTAGIRILCIDGGGIRGVVPLTFLQDLDRSLSHFKRPLGDYFDYVCGTSAGGLIAIGLFLMKWTPLECLTRFEDLSQKTFLLENQTSNLSLTQRLRSFVGAYVRDHRYDSAVIESAFRSTVGQSPRMFNPLQNDTKVAVTSTTARGNVPCLFSNYNGAVRTDQSTYCHVRADKQDHEISICDAAVCTSAAPFFFKPKDVANLDTFQDGGLEHNNPAFIAQWECSYLWPDGPAGHCNGRMDHMISLGTGTTSLARYRIGPHSPVKDRFLKRLVGSFMGHLDSEKQWRTFYSCISDEARGRYHRLNISFPGPEPALDEVSAMKRLKRQASDFMSSDPQSALARDAIAASIFYIELDRLSRVEKGMYACSGTIRCRLPLDYSGRKALYKHLLEQRACFWVAGRSIPCAETVPKGLPAFRRQVSFVMQSLEHHVEVSITGITTKATPISGLPRPLQQIIAVQGLISPFGCADNRAIEKPLPSINVSRKRKLRDR
ncbi:FabD/lysophospholipase-like protein [Polyplosphaeria fusca]|uniref:FabD/lysophospholipase-like protein n=1 Tax=Polyplosphaeria fusca TaxID=682080 RepID=A0A9P4UWV8_9PLEO|nr:FabD/lysophospholipase-like protein [Polyplosphaeria fusca]